MAKLPSGVLNANINWLGNWQLCNSVTAKFGNTTEPMKAKYCRAELLSSKIDDLAGDLPIPKDFGFNYGLCISSACNENEVKSIVSNCKFNY
jgi:hypothetical protein